MSKDILVLRSPAKLNLFLHIIGRHPDGYHLLQSVFQLIDWCDTITLKAIPENEVHRVNPIPGVPPEQDLVVRAAKLLKEFCQFDAGVEIELQKEGNVAKADRELFSSYQKALKPYLGKVIKGSNIDLVLKSK